MALANLTMRIIILICSIWLLGCSRTNYEYKPEIFKVLTEQEGRATLENLCSREAPEQVTEFWQPDSTQLEILFTNFKRIYELESTGCCLEGERVSDAELYYYHFVGLTLENQKHIYVNAISNRVGDVDIITINCDGGSDFWGVLFNLETERFFRLNMNGII